MNDWVAQDGPQSVFYAWGGTAFGCLVGIPIMYVFGKKYRSHWARHNLLEKFNIRTHAE
jgi:membrane protein DedA with SNARE-associated domain